MYLQNVPHRIATLKEDRRIATRAKRFGVVNSINEEIARLREDNHAGIWSKPSSRSVFA